ncbi:MULTISPECIES: hypothetical protein [unclassified Bradyrhizobium]|uniref:hypothetical protein n=1 Tax=unclassified Bradyrhizobium TaxID=2631580 RepID=UPI001CD75408|nr:MULTISPECIES: hypothetical protein [unclassified Bradyrhizobium]MCA1378898.1 hypothetical protein [Bradyrhizobium sp. IC4060]MCA1488918.1 hypothetical protein [Bradyrhizobium sp. IC4061]
MSNISFAQRVQKLVTFCDQRGFQDLNDLLLAALLNDASPAICMTEGCNHTPIWGPIKIKVSARRVAARQCFRQLCSPA